MKTRAGGVAAAVSGAVLAAVLTGCSGSSPAAPAADAAPSGSPASAAAIATGGDRAQELDGLRAAIAAPVAPFSAAISVETYDDDVHVRGQGTVGVSDVQTSSMGLAMLAGDAPVQVYTTTTRDAVYTRVDGEKWVKHPRNAGAPLVADHRPMVRALLEADPASYLGLEKLHSRNGGMAYHLAGALPVAAVSDALGEKLRMRIAERRIELCATDLLVDGAGRLAELTLTCEGGGYKGVSTLSLGEYGPAADVEAPSDL
ncbi:hypothetical protein HUT16_35515 [Kitasatospora sp. NA04385]|uniref:hypothetical protein n=1 Tax=Kitasatospora sp. NA04385 TaxID=2742135 RepID=UPI001590F47E|nr:hypothetical protein [Kitasatospora sp. NA04385]QKW23707.1 hypothetical protein HUT16_35515 [Kitasatospora sp. NA04385]